MIFIIIVATILAGLIIRGIALTIRDRREHREDLAAQVALIEAERNATIDPAEAQPAGPITVVLDTPIMAQAPGKIASAPTVTLLGDRFTDGTILVRAIQFPPDQMEKTIIIRIGPTTEITEGGSGRTFDRCGVGLLRAAGVRLPVRLPRTVEVDSQAKAWRPAGNVTADLIISYRDADQSRTTRRISVLAMEAIGNRTRTFEVRLHAWCWLRGDYRTFNLSRVRSAMDVRSGLRVDKLEWARDHGRVARNVSEALVSTR